MQIEGLAVRLKLRSPKEALDLGCLMARHWYVRLLAVTLVTVIPVMLVLALLVPEVWQQCLMLWWLKPLFERLPLWVLGRLVWTAPAGLSELRQGWRALWFRQILQSLTWRRLSGARSLDLPVTVLEGLGGKRRQQRLAWLHGLQTGRTGWMWTLFLVHLETLLLVSAYLLIWFFLPEDEAMQTWLLESEALSFYLLGGILSLVLPFYVAGGFALYLNRRVELEGWELELVFRRLRQRLERRAEAVSPGAATLCLLLAVLLGTFLPGGIPVAFAEAPSASDNRDLAKTRIETLIAESPFTGKEVVQIPTWLYELDWSGKQEKDNDTSSWAWLEDFASWVEWIFVLILVTLCLALLWQARNLPLGRFRKFHAGQRQAGEILPVDAQKKALDPVPESHIEALWTQGRQAEAVNALYQNVVRRLMGRTGVSLADSSTENEVYEALRYGISSPMEAALLTLTGWQLRFRYGQAPVLEESEFFSQHRFWQALEPQLKPDPGHHDA